MSEFMCSLPNIEENLLREIEVHLQMFRNRAESGEPLRAAEVLTQIPTEKLATLMAWAQVALRDHVIGQRNTIKGEAVMINPMYIPFTQDAHDPR